MCMDCEIVIPKYWELSHQSDVARDLFLDDNNDNNNNNNTVAMTSRTTTSSSDRDGDAYGNALTAHHRCSISSSSSSSRRKNIMSTLVPTISSSSKQPMSNPVIAGCVVGSPRWLCVGLEAKDSDDRVDVIRPFIHSPSTSASLPTTFPAHTAPPQHNPTTDGPNTLMTDTAL
ncbi:uncharacterized protein K489DRAFT_371140 [Dissoconium aciculare CBS 342.82]|uniref:Uncharacterized protein n=1 Tax=Dissoconium aciculare CBS 342.82 TaxID=1314786 RepID=A0A6J3M318_9PEZI|nr:uncharacterized protein K489DRAFT_371140 [Dissoconium aciculare CBS 342.82]KAF1822288.1 hypothetical protein K489DRAFT_371140 [Dissoconium aciculare CBS 342.82]